MIFKSKLLFLILVSIVTGILLGGLVSAWTNPPGNPPTGGGAPSGTVWLFDLSSCPNGWSKLTSGQGRYIVGLNDGGTLAATVGTALTDQENRAVGQHTHTGSTNSTGAHVHNLHTAAATTGSWDALLKNFTRSSPIWASTYTETAGSHSHTVTVNDSGTVAGTNAPYIQLLVCQKN